MKSGSLWNNVYNGKQEVLFHCSPIVGPVFSCVNSSSHRCLWKMGVSPIWVFVGIRVIFHFHTGERVECEVPSNHNYHFIKRGDFMGQLPRGTAKTKHPRWCSWELRVAMRHQFFSFGTCGKCTCSSNADRSYMNTSLKTRDFQNIYYW